MPYGSINIVMMVNGFLIPFMSSIECVIMLVSFCRYEQECDIFKTKVLECIQKCKEKIYDPPNTDDPHAIK